MVLGGAGYYIYATIDNTDEREARASGEITTVEDEAQKLMEDEQPYLYIHSTSTVQPDQLELYDENNINMILEESNEDFGIEHKVQFKFLFPPGGTTLVKLITNKVEADTLLTIVDKDGNKKFEKPVKNSENHRFINCGELQTLAQFPDTNTCPGDSDAATYIDKIDPTLKGEDLDAAKVSVTYFINNCSHWCNYDIRNPEAVFRYTDNQVIYDPVGAGEQCQTEHAHLMEEAKQRKEDICFEYE